jgi:hypothetical protein
MESEGSLQRSQKPTTGLGPELDTSIPRHKILYLQDQFNYGVFQLKSCAQFLSL